MLSISCCQGNNIVLSHCASRRCQDLPVVGERDYVVYAWLTINTSSSSITLLSTYAKLRTITLKLSQVQIYTSCTLAPVAQACMRRRDCMFEFSGLRTRAPADASLPVLSIEITPPGSRSFGLPQYLPPLYQSSTSARPLHSVLQHGYP